jgi:hypothetical protein
LVLSFKTARGAGGAAARKQKKRFFLKKEAKTSIR